MSLPPPPPHQPGYPPPPGPYGQQPYGPPNPYAPPSPSGQPLYPSEPYYPGVPTFPPGAVYPSAPRGYGYPQPAAARMSQPLTGWLLLGTAVLVIIGSLTPWVTIHIFDQSATIDGTTGDGKLTIFCGGIVAVTGLLIGLRQGRLWTSIVALVFAVVTVLIGFADLGNISQLYGPAKDFPDSVFSVGFGLWLVLIGGVAGLVLSIVAMVRRPELAPQH